MHICNFSTTNNFNNKKPIPGHLYQLTGGIYRERIYLCTKDNSLVSLRDGVFWSKQGSGFGKVTSPEKWKDVTEEYCLEKIE